MEITIKRVVDEKGNIVLTINGEGPCYGLSRKLTGATDEDTSGIFTASKTGEEFLWYGKYKQKFFFKKLDIENPILEYKENLAYNIRLVKAWVDECKKKATSEEVTFTI